MPIRVVGGIGSAFAAVALTLIVAQAAAGLGVPGTGTAASGDGDLVAAPVEVQEVMWADPVFVDATGWVIDQVDVRFLFTDSFNGVMHFRVRATGTDSSLPDGTDEFRTLNVSAGQVVTLETFFTPPLPVAGLDDIHVMVCNSSAAQPFGRCAP